MPNCSPSTPSLAGSPGGRGGGAGPSPSRCGGADLRAARLHHVARTVATGPFSNDLPAGHCERRRKCCFFSPPAVRSGHAPRPGGRGGSSPPSSGIRGKKVCLRAGGLRCPRWKRCSREDPGEVVGPSSSPCPLLSSGNSRRNRQTVAIGSGHSRMLAPPAERHGGRGVHSTPRGGSRLQAAPLRLPGG